MKKARVFALLHLALCVGAIAFIFFNGTQRSAASNARSDVLVEWLKPLFDPKNRLSEYAFSVIVRKAAHMAEYALLAFFGAMSVFWAKLGGIRVSLFAVTTAVMALGLLDEFLQSLTDRTSAVKDVLFDTAGGLCGILAAAVCFAFLRWLLRRAERRKNR